MKAVLIALSLLLVSFEAHAISRYNSTSMSCGEIKATVRAEGAADPALARQQRRPALTGASSAHGGFCESGTRAEISYVPSPTANPARFANASTTIRTTTSSSASAGETRLSGLEAERLLRGGRRPDPHAFERQHLLLGRRAARRGEAADLAARRQDAMAGNDQRHRIGPERLAGLARQSGMAGALGEFAIGRGLAEGRACAPRRRWRAGNRRRRRGRPARRRSRSLRHRHRL